MAIFILLLLAGLAMFTLSAARIHAHFFADTYAKEQAGLFADSVLEAALMKIEANRTDLSFTSPDGRFTAAVAVERCYVVSGYNDENANCKKGVNVTVIDTPASHGYMLLRLEVNGTADSFLTPIRITKRTLQRP